VARVAEAVGDMGADEPRAAGDKDTHGESLTISQRRLAVG
jgi:hypothetical protein